MITHHQNSVFLFNGSSISALTNTKNKLSLSSIHSLIKASRIHSKRIQILFSSDISISTYKTFNTQKQIIVLLKPTTIKPIPIFIFQYLIILISLVQIYQILIYNNHGYEFVYQQFINNQLLINKIYKILQNTNKQIFKQIKISKHQTQFQNTNLKTFKLYVRQKQMIEQSLQGEINDQSNKNQQRKQIIQIQQIAKPTQSIVHPLEQLIMKKSSSSSNQSNLKQTCVNKICPKYKLQAKSKQLAFDPQDLCKQCLTQYKKQAYCLYCKQIYFDSSDDGKQWILCDSCGRWVHSQCANYDHSSDQDFKCIKCKKNQPFENITALVKKQSTKVNSNINGNPKTAQRRKLTECSLNNFGFYWQLAPNQHAQDMDKIRQFLQ